MSQSFERRPWENSGQNFPQNNGRMPFPIRHPQPQQNFPRMGMVNRLPPPPPPPPQSLIKPESQPNESKSYQQNENKSHQQNEGRPYQQNEGRPFQQNEGRPFPQNEGRPFPQNEGRPFPQNEGRPFPQNEGRPFPQNEGRPFPQNEGRPYPQNEGRPYPQNEGRPFPQNEGRPFPQNEGRPYQQNEGRPYQQNEGRPYQQNDGRPFPPNEGRPFPPNEGRPFPPHEGRPYPQNEGRPFQQNEGRPYQQNEGRPFQPNEGRPYPQNEGRPYQQNEGRPYQQNEGRPYQQSNPRMGHNAGYHGNQYNNSYHHNYNGYNRPGPYGYSHMRPKKPVKKRVVEETPKRSWSRADAIRAIETESKHKNVKESRQLMIRFPDLDLNPDIVKGFNEKIRNVHFQAPCGPRYCFVQLEDNADMEAVIEDINKIHFQNGYLKAEMKTQKEEEQVLPELIDPYCLYVGNLPHNITSKKVKELFSKSTRIDIGFAQKIKFTRYAFIRFANVDDAIESYKNNVDLIIDARSVVLRFRRGKGTQNPPGTSCKKESEDIEKRKDQQDYSLEPIDMEMDYALSDDDEPMDIGYTEYYQNFEEPFDSKFPPPPPPLPIEDKKFKVEGDDSYMDRKPWKPPLPSTPYPMKYELENDTKPIPVVVKPNIKDEESRGYYNEPGIKSEKMRGYDDEKFSTVNPSVLTYIKEEKKPKYILEDSKPPIFKEEKERKYKIPKKEKISPDRIKQEKKYTIKLEDDYAPLKMDFSADVKMEDADSKDIKLVGIKIEKEKGIKIEKEKGIKIEKEIKKEKTDKNAPAGGEIYHHPYRGRPYHRRH